MKAARAEGPAPVLFPVVFGEGEPCNTGDAAWPKFCWRRFLREQSRERGKADNIVEAGVRHDFGNKLSLGAGVGVGFGPDSPRYRLLVGVQRSF